MIKDTMPSKRVLDFARNLGGDFSEIVLLIEQECEYNDADTNEYKLAMCLLSAIEEWVVGNLVE
jgi:hypothetical protein